MMAPGEVTTTLGSTESRNWCTAGQQGGGEGRKGGRRWPGKGRVAQAAACGGVCHGVRDRHKCTTQHSFISAVSSVKWNPKPHIITKPFVWLPVESRDTT